MILPNFAKIRDIFGKMLTQNWDRRTVQRSSIQVHCVDLGESFSNAYVFAKFSLDTAENEPSGDVDLMRRTPAAGLLDHATLRREGRVVSKEWSE